MIDVSTLRMLLLTVTSWLDHQKREMLVYEENRVLRRQVGGRRLRLTDDDRRRLAVRAHRLGRRLLHSVGGCVLISVCYLFLRCVLPLAIWRWRSPDVKELEIAVLRHELTILRRQTKRPAMTAVDRLFLAATSRVLPRSNWRSFIITPDTPLRWHRRPRADDAGGRRGRLGLAEELPCVGGQPQDIPLA